LFLLISTRVDTKTKSNQDNLPNDEILLNKSK